VGNGHPPEWAKNFHKQLPVGFSMMACTPRPTAKRIKKRDASAALLPLATLGFAGLPAKPLKLDRPVVDKHNHEKELHIGATQSKPPGAKRSTNRARARNPLSENTSCAGSSRMSKLAAASPASRAGRQTEPAPLNTSTQARSRAPEKEPSKEAQVCPNTAGPADMARLRAESRRQGRPAARGAMSPGGAAR